MKDREVETWRIRTPYGPLVVSRGRHAAFMPEHRHVRPHCVFALSGHYWEGASLGERRRWRAGDVVVFPRRFRHRTWFPAEEAMIAALRLSVPAAAALGIPTKVLSTTSMGHELRLGLRDALLAAKDGVNGDAASLRLFVLLDVALTVTGEARSTPDWLREIRRRLDLDLTARPSLADLAALVGKDATHISYAFKGAFGVTITQYVQRARVHAAALLLADPDRSITEAAHLSGFADAAHFARSFRGLSRATASEFRRARSLSRTVLLSGPAGDPKPVQDVARYAG